MFVAWRELRFARGRFVLIGSVVALITVLVGFLTGLTGGLAAQNVSALLGLPGDRIVLQQQPSGTATFSESAISPSVQEQWRSSPGVRSVTPIGIAQTRAAHGSTGTGVAIFSVPTGAPASTVSDLAPATDEEIGLSAGAADALHAGTGDTVSLGGSQYRVSRVGGDAWYSHTPVIAMTPAAWAAFDKRTGGDGLATLLAVQGDPDWSAVAKATHTVAQPPLSALPHLETFRSEIGSLAQMVAMLFGISALVVGAFFTVWTMQRAADIAVLKALGASTNTLMRDALGQALVVLVAGVGAGLLIVVGLGLLVSGALPFMVNAFTTAVPALAMVVLGLAGAAVALRTITKADPLTALGSNR
ncbi:ABC transporter permease [Branchiibius cervicis]|uniref:ABC transporter permease n=1 Tax=Branchiibius cervicis TaxID=908252 RepID=A0ABW2AP91_9MICO